MNTIISLARPTATLVGVSLLLASAVAGPLPKSMLIDKGKVLAISDQINRDAYPNADSVLVDDYEKIIYQADGTAEQWDEVYVKILTEKGKRENQTLSTHFTIPYSTVRIPLVEVIKPDGVTHVIDVSKQSNTMIDRSQMRSNIYNPNQKVLQVGVPGLEPGDLLHYLIHRDTLKTRIPDSWSDYFVLEYTAPIKHYAIEIIGPKERPLRKIQVKDEVKGTIAFSRKETGDKIIYRWEINDVPRMYEEPNMPALHTVVQRLLVSTIPDWRDISKWYSKLCEPHLRKTTPEMKLKVDELVADANGREEQIEAIFQYVSQNIRYMGITTETVAPGYEPHDVNVTFENKYGVCRDKAALLVAMLRLAGFNAHPVLIHNGPKKDEEVPQPYFNHAISCVVEGDGTQVLMDPTDENTQDLFPAYLCNQSYLVAMPRGDALRTSPVMPANKNMMKIETKGTVSKSGALKATTKLFFEGINDNLYRGYFARLKPEEVKQFFERKLRNFVSGANVVKFTVVPNNLTDVSKQLRVEIDFETDHFILKGDNETIVKPPWFGASFGIVNFVLGKTGLRTRKYPLKTDIPCGVEETLHLDLDGCVGSLASKPVYDGVDDSNVTWKRQLTLKGKVLNGETEFLIKRDEFTPNQYHQLKEDLIKIERGDKAYPIFKSVPPPPLKRSRQDAITINWETEVTLSDDQTWTIVERVKRKILSYAGKKAYAEIKINYNPTWESVKLVNVSVASPSGTSKSLSDEEINVMDASWVGSAPRYPPGKTLVASLPNVEINSVLEYEIRKRISQRPFFSLVTPFQSDIPIEARKVTLNVPKTAKIKLSPPASDDVSFKRSTTKDNTVYAWSASDLPPIVSENNLPPVWSFVPCLLASNGDWYNYSQELKAFLTNASLKQSKSAALAKKLVASLSNVNDKIRAIRDHVARNVRPAGPDFNDIPLANITPADKTLSDGYGNSADRAVLLHAMLRSVGIESEFTLASSFPNVPEIITPLNGTPQRFLYNEVLIKCDAKPTMIYLNDTNQYAKLGTTPHAGYPSLFLDTGLTHVINPKSNMENKSEISFNIKIKRNGDAVITRHETFYGTHFSNFHETFAEMPPEKRDRHFQETIGAISLAAKPMGDLTTNFNIYPGVKEYTVSVPKFAVTEGPFLYFTLPETFKNLISISSAKRENPYYLNHATRKSVHYFITLPTNAKSAQITPSPWEWFGPRGSGSVATTSEIISKNVFGATPSMIKFSEVVDLTPALIPVDHFDDLIDLKQRISSPTMDMIFITSDSP